MKRNKVCSSDSLPGLEKLINEYFYSTNWVASANEMAAVNRSTGKRLGKIEFKQNRYIFYL